MADSITNTFIKGRSWAPRLGDKRQVDLQDEQHGLILRVSRSRSGKETFTWCVIYRNKRGQKRRWGLGRWPDLDYKDARKLAARIQGDIASDIDPVQRRRDEIAERLRKQQQGLTVGKLAEMYLTEGCGHKREGSIRTDRLMLAKEVLPVIGFKRATDVTTEDISVLLKQIVLRGSDEVGRHNHVRSNRVRSVIGSIFTYAVEERMVTANPVGGLGRRKREFPRARRLNEDEIKKLWEVLGEGDVADQYRLMILTAQRPGEVARMEWQDLDLRGWWTIPEAKSKNHTERRVALGPMALEILQRRNPQRIGYVFPKAAKHRSIPSWRQAKINEACGFVKPWQPRDLRRTAGSEIASEFGRSIMAHVLGHTDQTAPAVSRTYDTYDYDREKRRAMLWLDGRLRAIVSGEAPADNVIQFPGGPVASQSQ